jgi:NAD(P)-dependent dehydrogenase (short-subunit alcohol dehydrogenase family)
MFSEFRYKVVLITGAAGGIGSALVKEFSKYKAKVYPTDIKENLKNMPVYFQGDISEPDFITSWVQHIMDKEGRIDILINNAGICPRTPVLNISREEWERVMNINLSSVFQLSRYALDIMINQKSGVIVNLASIAGKVGGITVGAHYSASKAAIECLTKSLAKTGAPHGVRVNAVAPGVIDTEMQNGLTKGQLDSFLKNIPMKRMGSPGEVAHVILALSSSYFSYVTGINLDINGGLHM